MIIQNGKSTIALYKGTKEIVRRYKGTLLVYESFLNLLANGVPPLTLTNCKGADLVDYKIFGNSIPEETRLPDEYQEVEYITSKTSGDIITDVVATNNIGIDMILRLSDIAGSQYILGSRESKIDYAMNGSASRTDWDVRFNGSVIYSNVVRNTDKWRTKISMINGNGTWYLSNLDTGEEWNFDIKNVATINSTIPLTLFSYNTSQGANSYYYHGGITVYSLKMYDGETLIRDFKPCYRKSDNVIGMYDLVNNKFYEPRIKTPSKPFTIGDRTGVELESVGEKTKNLIDFFNINSLEMSPQNDKKAYVLKDLVAGETYTISFSFVDENDICTYLYFYDRDENGNYESEYLTTGKTTYPKLSFKVESGHTYYIQRGGNFNITQTEIDKFATFQLEKGPVATDNEPYGYKIPVKVHSKNWFDINNLSTDRIYNALVEEIENGFRYTANDNGTYTTYVSYLVDPTELLGKRVILSGDTILSEGNSGMFRFGYWSTANAFTSFAMKQISNNGYQELIVDIPDTLPDDYKTGLAIFFNVTVIANMKGATFEVTNIKLELEPITTNLYLDAPLRKIGDYSDIIDFKQGKVIRRIGKYTYDGSEDWIKNASTTDGYGAFRCEGYFTPLIGAPANMSYMTHFNYTTKGATADFKPGEFRFAYGGGSNIGSSRVYMATIQTTVEDFVDWVTKNKPTIYYPIEEIPEEIDLPNIPTFNGTTILEINTDIQPSNLDVIYKGKK